jgi:DNA-binding NarL/FixJ family response regulator
VIGLQHFGVCGSQRYPRHKVGVEGHRSVTKAGDDVNKPVRVAVIEDHPLFRDAITARVTSLLPSVDFPSVGSNIDEAIVEHANESLDLVILDLDLGDGRSPVSNTAELVDAGCRVLIVSGLGKPDTVRPALRAGALGFVSKQSEGSEFEDAFFCTLAGEPSTSRDVAAILAEGEAVSVPLTERERTAMVLFASGLTIDAVARRMGVKTSTAQEYIKRVRGKYLRSGTAMPSKTDLYRQAREEGLVS